MTKKADPIRVALVKFWNEHDIVQLYKAGRWWKDEFDPAGIAGLIQGSFAFAVAFDTTTGHAIGMGRVISDGVSDAYIQDLVVQPAYRDRGIGVQILTLLVEHCKKAGLTWIGLIAEPDSEAFYTSLGFERMPRHIPMIYRSEQ
ncbi:MAG: GNAT family N-acetyltransferase [Methanoregula sp.]|nr:GNAT family N-acetyltransferase [Methanoregula sp.]